jgi:hypothetical protein
VKYQWDKEPSRGNIVVTYDLPLGPIMKSLTSAYTKISNQSNQPSASSLHNKETSSYQQFLIERGHLIVFEDEEKKLDVCLAEVNNDKSAIFHWDELKIFIKITRYMENCLPEEYRSRNTYIELFGDQSTLLIIQPTKIVFCPETQPTMLYKSKPSSVNSDGVRSPKECYFIARFVEKQLKRGREFEW